MLSASSDSALGRRPFDLPNYTSTTAPFMTLACYSARGNRLLKACLSHPGMLPDPIGSLVPQPGMAHHHVASPAHWIHHDSGPGAIPIPLVDPCHNYCIRFGYQRTPMLAY